MCPNIPSASPQSPEDIAQAKQREEEKVQRELDEKRDMLSMDILQNVTTQIVTMEEEIRVKNDALQKAITQRQGWTQDAVIYAKKDAIVQTLEQELAGVRTKLDTLKNQQGIIKGHISFIYEKMPKGRTDISASDLKHIIWHPTMSRGKAVESSSPVPGAGTILREKVDGKEGEYIYTCLAEDGSDAYFRVYAPGQVREAETQTADGRPIAVEQEKALGVLDILNKPREEWRQGMLALVKDPKNAQELQEWATQEMPMDGGNALDFQKELLSVILEKNAAISGEIMRVWKERLDDPADVRRNIDTIKRLSLLGNIPFGWALDVYEKKVQTDPLTAKELGTSLMGDALLAANNPTDKDMLMDLKRRFESAKNPFMRAQLLLMLCQSDLVFEQTVSSDDLWNAAMVNESVCTAVLPVFIKRKDPRTVELLEKIMKSGTHFEADLVHFTSVMLDATRYVQTLPDAEKQKIIKLCDDLMGSDTVLQPLFFRMFAALNKPGAALEVAGIGDNHEMILRMQMLLQANEELDARIAALKNIPADQRMQMMKAQAPLPGNQQLLILKNQADVEVDQVANDIAKDAAELIHRLQKPDAPNLLPIPNDVVTDAENAIQDAFKSIAWDDTMFEPIVMNAPGVYEENLLREQLAPRLKKIFENGRMKKLGIDDTMCEKWVDLIVSDKKNQAAVHTVMQARMVSEIANGNKLLEEKLVDHLLQNFEKGQGEKQFANVFGKNFALKSKLLFAQNTAHQGIYAGGSVLPVAAAAAPVAATVVAAKITGSAKPLEEASVAPKESSEKEVEKISPALKPLLENTITVVNDGIQYSRGTVDGYDVVIAESDFSTRAFLQMKNEMLELPTPDVSGLNTVVIDRGNQTTVFYNLEKQQIEDPYEKKQNDILSRIFEIDTATSVVHDKQIQYISDGMHLLFRGAADTIRAAHPLRVLGIITDDDKIDEKRADQFRELFHYHMDEIRDWTFADMQALTKLWEKEDKFVFAPLIDLRGEA